MILLLGGTSETAPLAEAMARAGRSVLVSMATDVALEVGEHPAIERRRGRMDKEQMAALVHELQMRAIVDATHPYASAVRATAREVSEATGVPYLTWVRPSTTDAGDTQLAADHGEAARLACGPGRPVLLTTGSRNLLPYASESRRAGVLLVARVLDHPDSLAACEVAGLEHVVTGRGPFSVEDNRALIRRYDIGVLVTKDSGAAGGVPAKLEAARAEGCHVVMVRRPADTATVSYASLEDLVAALP